MDALLQAKLFATAREVVPGCEKKVVAVAGDITKPGLGISAAQRKDICEEVSVILHVAATINFSEKIQLAVKMNCIALQMVIDLANDLKDLAAVVHTSTAYSHTYREVIPDEEFLEGTYDPSNLIELCDLVSPDVAEAATPALIKGHPNTYTFTKCCAERLVRDAHDAGLPICIVRPSIVTPTWREPYVGWTDTFNGPTGIMLAAGSGLLRIMPATTNYKVDMVPVDIVANFLIAAAWHTYSARCAPNGDKFRLPGAPIFNCTSGNCGNPNPSTIKTWVDGINIGWNKYPMQSRLVRRPSLECIQRGRDDIWSLRSWLYKYFQWASEYIPGYLVDVAARVQGKAAFSAAVWDRMGKSISDYEFFLNHEFDWAQGNVKRLEATMSSQDRESFCINMIDLEWPTYIEQVVLGIKKWKLKEGVDSKTVEDARRQLQMVAFRGLLVRVLTGAFFVRVAAALGFVKHNRMGRTSTWVALLIMAYYSRAVRRWVIDYTA